MEVLGVLFIFLDFEGLGIFELCFIGGVGGVGGGGYLFIGYLVCG